MQQKYILAGVAIAATFTLAAPGIAGDFNHCTWNGRLTACRATKMNDGYEIYYPNGGATQRIIYAGGSKVWIINDGVKEPGTISGRTVTRLTDGIKFSF